MSLFSGLLAMLGSLENDAIAIHEERCVSLRNRNASCQRCADACTSGVIIFNCGELRAEPSRCIGCGTCATACPTCAIEVRKPSDAELFQRLAEVAATTEGHPVIACEQTLEASEAEQRTKRGILKKRMAKAAPAYDSTRVVALPCLGRVDETVLVGLAAHGAASVTLVCANCASCERAPGGALVRQVVESAKNLLEAFSSSLCVELASRLPARVAGEKSDADQPNDPSRRDFFRSFKDGTLGVAASAAGLAEDERVSTDARASATAPSLPSRLKVGANGTLPQFIPERRTRVFGYLEHLGAPVAEAVECRIAGAVTIEAQRCEACRMCAVFCPTGALARADEDGRWGLVHRPSACVGCRLCEKVCPRKALSVGARVPMRQFLGEKAVWFKLKPPAWTPNKPDSMFTKMRLVLGDDTEMCMF